MAHVEMQGRKITFSLPGIAMISAVFAIVIWIAGHISGYLLYSQDIHTVITQYIAFEKRLGGVEGAVGGLTGDMKYTRQDIAEIKVYILPKK